MLRPANRRGLLWLARTAGSRAVLGAAIDALAEADADADWAPPIEAVQAHLRDVAADYTAAVLTDGDADVLEHGADVVQALADLARASVERRLGTDWAHPGHRPAVGDLIYPDQDLRDASARRHRVGFVLTRITGRAPGEVTYWGLPSLVATRDLPEVPDRLPERLL